MQSLLPLATLIFAAAITPGPNNYLVLRSALDGGAAAAARAVVGVVVGGCAMLLLALAGVTRNATLGRAIALAGAAYLAWLGLRQLRDAWRPTPAADGGAAVLGVWRMAAFQWLNPKAWVLVSTVAASAAVDGAQAPPAATFGLFIALTTGCLTLWAAGGRVAVRWLRDLRVRRGFDATMGALLLVSALALALRDGGAA